MTTATPEELRHTVLAKMRDASFRANDPNLFYAPPDTVELTYGDCGGGELRVHYEEGKVRVRPLSGSWSGSGGQHLGPGWIEEEDDDFRVFVAIADPRAALECLTECALESDQGRRVLTGRLDLERSGVPGGYVGVPDEWPYARLTLDDQDRVIAMTIVARYHDPLTRQLEEHEISDLLFAYS